MSMSILLREFGKEYPRVKFAVPASNVRYKHDAGDAAQELPLAGN